MANRGRPRKNKEDAVEKRPPGRPAGLYGEDVLVVINMPPNRFRRFEYASEKETQSKYRCMRRAVRQLGLDILVRKVHHRIEVYT